VVFSNRGLDSAQLDSAEAYAGVQSHRIEPELGLRALALHMNVRRFLAIRGIEEESIGAGSQDRGHG
jgi:hypothetical protein